MFKINWRVPAGPFQLMDQIGLDVVLDIENHYAEECPYLPKKVRELLQTYVDAETRRQNRRGLLHISEGLNRISRWGTRSAALQRCRRCRRPLTLAGMTTFTELYAQLECRRSNSTHTVRRHLQMHPQRMIRQRRSCSGTCV